MSINEIADKLEALFPHSLARFEFNGFLTSFPKHKTQANIAFTLGYSEQAITRAIKEKVDLLVVHNAPESLVPEKNNYFESIAKRVRESSLSVYRLHLPLDFVRGGIIDQLCRMMKLNAIPATLFYQGQRITGGVYLSSGSFTVDEVIKRVKLLRPSTIRLVKGGKEKVKNIAITSGDGCKPEFLLQLKPDVFICGLLNQESI
ncbi:MAG: Nif3-like dinuclear metal center hexameric protein, partial [Candidatus Levybacteria bacterium]|nr:Nif3-like dinuclear metal center hexameric protein [Candidatus Levybacteria bacterium]